MACLYFLFDVGCPHSYIASKRIESLCARARIEVEWCPVQLSRLRQGPGLATTTPAAKKRMMHQDLIRQAARHGVQINFNPQHPSATHLAQEALSVAPKEVRASLARDLFDAYWVQNKDLDNPEVLAQYCKKYGLSAVRIAEQQASELLRTATERFSRKGVFGVPSFFVGEGKEFFWGQDRLHFVEQALGMPSSLPRFQVQSRISLPRPQVTFYFDFASPWSFLGFTQLHRLDGLANVTMKPILLGALFRSIGTPNLPMMALTEKQRQYGSKDMKDWQEWWGEELRWPDTFPIRTVTALRVAIAEPKTINLLYRGAWQRNIDLGCEKALAQLLDENGFNSTTLLAAARQIWVKEELRENTADAVRSGVCGVPTYKLSDVHGKNHVIWGQDRIDVVQDIACGWAPGSLCKL